MPRPQGTPETMQIDPRYENVLLDVYDWLEARIALAEQAGIARARIARYDRAVSRRTLQPNGTMQRCDL